MIKINVTDPEILAAFEAQERAYESMREKFEESFRSRSFSGRNAELGKMMKCPLCGMRDRESVIMKHDHKVAEASPRRYRPVGNPFWRSKPGKFIWIPELKKFMTLTR